MKNLTRNYGTDLTIDHATFYVVDLFLNALEYERNMREHMRKICYGLLPTQR